MPASDPNTGPSSSQDPASVLRSASFSLGQSSIKGNDSAVTATDVFNASFDPSRLHPLADLKDDLEYLMLEDDKTNELPGSGTALPSRGWSDDLCYGTGTTYLSGMSYVRIFFRSVSTYWVLNRLLSSLLSCHLLSYCSNSDSIFCPPQGWPLEAYGDSVRA